MRSSFKASNFISLLTKNKLYSVVNNLLMSCTYISSPILFLIIAIKHLLKKASWTYSASRMLSVFKYHNGKLQYNELSNNTRGYTRGYERGYTVIRLPVRIFGLIRSMTTFFDIFLKLHLNYFIYKYNIKRIT